MNWMLVGSPRTPKPLGTQTAGNPAPFPIAPITSLAVAPIALRNSWPSTGASLIRPGATSAS